MNASAEDDFSAAVGGSVDGGEALEHADRIVEAQHRDGGSQANPICARGDGGEYDFGCRDGKIGAMVFSDAEEVDAELVGEHGFVDHVADDLRMRQHLAVITARDVAECIKTKFERHPSAPS